MQRIDVGLVLDRKYGIWITLSWKTFLINKHDDFIVIISIILLLFSLINRYLYCNIMHILWVMISFVSWILAERITNT
jgi:hypothetical protein